jgi:UDP-glucose 4-epimerase
MKKILILGSTGFIGRNLTEQLSQKYLIFAPKRRELDLRNGKAVDAYFQNNVIDVVVNCAIVGGARPEEMGGSVLSDNLRIFFNLLRNKKRYKKMIHLGSGAEYDKSRPIGLVGETEISACIPDSDYCLYKYICSQCIEKESHIVSLRIFGLFGKYEDYRYRFISHAILENIRGTSITIKQNVNFDYVYIDDFVNIVDYFISHTTHGKFYNIGSGRRVDLITIANIINSFATKKSKIIIGKKGLGNEYTCDNRRLMKEMKHPEFMDMEKSVKLLFDWYVANPI